VNFKFASGLAASRLKSASLKPWQKTDCTTSPILLLFSLEFVAVSLLSRLADRLILCPTTEPIDPEDRVREVLRGVDWQCELWGKRWDPDWQQPEQGRVAAEKGTGTPSAAVVQTRRQLSERLAGTSPQEWAVLKFPGTGGRAERAGPHPLELWPKASGEVWAVNPPGYGTSGGTAAVRFMPEVAAASWEFVRQRHPELPTLLVGNSLGGTSALHLAARHEVSALFLRNPPPIHQLIRRRPRYNWWNLGAARWVAAEFPASFNAVANAARCRAPALFVQSERDRLVPVSYQQEIIDAYAGPKRVFVISGADHHESLPDEQLPAYLEALEWLRAAASS
jgi:pimeloyl-ACP methyl ester carboxylesterase